MMTKQFLREAALRHLARYATTRAGLLRVLDRKIARWCAQNQSDSGAELQAVARTVVDALVGEGLINDAAYAETRARRLLRAGRSRRSVAADLAGRGISAVTISSESELAAALATARRRRIGPFRTAPVDEAGARREAAMLARAGFPRSVVIAALHMEPDPAEALVLQLKRQ
jgi:regulatory protein